MEYRKLISFGKNSYIVSLPKSWVEKNKLKKGDHIYIDEKADEISLYPRQKQEEDRTKEVIINVDGKDMTQIARAINTAYISHFNSFVISGKELQKNAKEIRSMLQNLMALEVMDQTATKIVARDFIDMSGVSPSDLIRKLDMITREMIRDSKNTLVESKFDNLYLRDEDVNRIAHLVFRAVRHALDNPQLAKKMNCNSVQLMTYWRIAYAVEGVADEAKRIAKFLHKSSMTKKEAEGIAELYSVAETFYLDSMKAYYNSDGLSAVNLAGTKSEIIKKANLLADKYGKNRSAVSTIEKIKNMTLTSNEISRITSHLVFENKKEF